MGQAIAEQESRASASLASLWSRVTAVKQLGLILGAAAALALIAGVFLWMQAPDYRVLYSGLSDKDAGQVAEALQKSAIPFKIDSSSGALLVPAEQVHGARLKLAAQGLPKGAGVGFEMLDEQQTFVTSQFMETARYQRALETELARSIATLNAVQHARVHLALSKQSVFVRDRQPTSASILVKLHPGRELEAGQVAAMVHLVASSVPQLTPSRVTVIDQNGRLLTRDENSQEMALSLNQLDYTCRIEASYVKRIEDILVPVVGLGKIRAQVAADIDFAVTEQTQEPFNPKTPGVRSEQLMDEQSMGSGAEGIPGALSNQPPGVATIPEKAAAPEGQVADERPLRRSRRETRNYELDKTISHTRLMPGGIRRLSVAVVVDDRVSKDEKGNPVRAPLTAEELARMTALVKEAVGFKADRGDTVNVTNAAFAPAVQDEAIPEPPLWERPWLLELVKLSLGALVLVAILFVVVRPLMWRALPQRRTGQAAAGELVPRTAAFPGKPGEIAEDRVSLTRNLPAFELPHPPEYESPLLAAKTLVEQDPRRAVQVLTTYHFFPSFQ
jgi:flagellar M-ring protein FliF